MTSHDPLSNFYTRAAFQERFADEIDRTRRLGGEISLIIADIDHFKLINDIYGHARGDQVLAELAQRISQSTRSTDLLFRFGGDEFIILAPNTGKHHALQLAERVIARIRAAVFAGNPPVSLSISVGVATLPTDAPDGPSLFAQADANLYQAKRGGRGRAAGGAVAPVDHLPFDALSRLIERAPALEVAQTFLQQLPARARGILSLLGPAGSGWTRFLAEVGKVAQLHGYAVLQVGGDTYLRQPYGALTSALERWGAMPAPALGPEPVVIALRDRVAAQEQQGLIICVDGPAQLDLESLGILRYILHQPLIGCVGVVYAAEHEATDQLMSAYALYHETITLEPLSLAGVGLLLRLILRWEPPEAFTGWVYAETNGLPQRIRAGLTDLVARGVLQQREGAWWLREDFRTARISPPAARATAPPHNLPAQLTHFVGRRYELAIAKQQLEAQRLLTLTGASGVGRTRLAIQIARETLGNYPHGVYLLPLPPDATLAALNLLLGQFWSYQPSEQERQAAATHIFEGIRSNCILLILDGVSDSNQARPIIQAVLRQTERWRVIATAQQPVGLDEEQIYRLTGLEFPPADTPRAPATFDAVQLFLQAAQRADRTFALTIDNAPTVARICRLVQGHPRKLEQAATWVRLLTCQEIAEEIELSGAFPDQ